MDTPAGYPKPGDYGPDEPHRRWKTWGIPPYPNNLDPYSYPKPKEDREKRHIELPRLHNYHRTPPIQNPLEPRVMYFQHGRPALPIMPMGHGSRWAQRPNWAVGNDRHPFWHYVSRGTFGRTEQPKPWVIEKLRDRPRFESWKKATPTQRPDTYERSDDGITVVSDPHSARRGFEDVVVAVQRERRGADQFKRYRRPDVTRGSPRVVRGSPRDVRNTTDRDDRVTRDVLDRFSNRRVVTPSDAKQYEETARKRQLANNAVTKFKSSLRS